VFSADLVRCPWRRTLSKLSIVLRLDRFGFLIPFRYAKTALAAATTIRYPVLEQLMQEAEPRFLELLDAMDRFAPALLAIGEERPPAPRWRQDWFPRLDAAAAYTLVCIRAPSLLVEMGSGHSTRWFARAAADAGHATRIVAVDPEPRAALEGLDAELVRATVQAAGEKPYAALGTQDVLSIDGSHVLMPGTDVDYAFNRVLPLLPAGVFVHVHDIFLPDCYPSEWAWRGYNEQLAVATLLQGRGWRILWSSHWVATRLTDRLARSVVASLPLLPGAHESSLWLEKL
jgi:hypothetical protein